jgi:hypothetical protein
MYIKEKEKYHKFLEQTHAKVPVFFQPWYLDVVCCKGQWDVMLSEDGDKSIIGFWVYYSTEKYGQPCIIMPPLTPYSGIWIYASQSTKNETKNKKNLSIVKELLDKIPQNITLYTQSFHYSFQNGLQFYWKKYTQTVRYTFYIDQLKIWSINDISTNVRNKINKASRILKYEISQNRERLYDLVYHVIKDKGMNLTLTKDMFYALDDAILQHSDRRIIIVRDNSGYIHAATYIIIDNDTAYMMMVGSDRTTRQNGAVPLAIYHSIIEVQPLVKHFDFEGSMLESMFDLFAGFGGELKPYYRFYKAKNIFWDILYRIKNHYDKNIR